MDMFCMGLLSYAGSTYGQCQNILKHISDPDANVRHAVLCAILSMVRVSHVLQRFYFNFL
jgi:hypothetical protein